MRPLYRVIMVLGLVFCATSSWAQWSTNGANVYWNTGNVGVGTATPGQKLDVAGNAKFTSPAGSYALGAAHVVFSASDGSPVGFQNTNNVAGSGAHMFDDTGNLKAYFQWNNSGVGVSPSTMVFGALGTDPIAFDTNLVERVRINGSTGNVGIGTAANTYKLDVNGTGHVSGNLTVDGNLAAKYQDVAEWVPATTKLAPGVVVVLNPSKSNEVMMSSTPYDTTVAGVVSAQPGVTLGEGSPNKATIAASGRVMVRVDARKHPIHVGDLLVTSDDPGRAMKSVPIEIGGRKIHQPGTIIGKALEPIESGEGEILVLLSLG